MDITGIVVNKSLNTQIPKTGGGSYEGWELGYKDLVTQEIKSIRKPSQSLKQVAGLREALEELTPGDKFVCSMEKVGQYWEIKGLTKGELATPLPTRKAWNNAAKPNREYETSEERALRQRLIVRQSSITSAIASIGEGKVKDAQAVLALAAQYENWVFRTDV